MQVGAEDLSQRENGHTRTDSAWTGLLNHARISGAGSKYRYPLQSPRCEGTKVGGAQGLEVPDAGEVLAASKAEEMEASSFRFLASPESGGKLGLLFTKHRPFFHSRRPASITPIGTQR